MGIMNASLVAQWFSRFRLASPDALRSHKKGRKPTMEKQTREKKEKKGKRPNGEDSVDTSTDRMKQLEDE